MICRIFTVALIGYFRLVNCPAGLEPPAGARKRRKFIVEVRRFAPGCLTIEEFSCPYYSFLKYFTLVPNSSLYFISINCNAKARYKVVYR